MQQRGLNALRGVVGGSVLDPSDPGYDEARVPFYTGFARRPWAIVQPIDADDVSKTVTMAAEHGLPLAVRSGGHSVAGFASIDDGIVLDMSSMDAVEIDPENRIARAGGGVTAGTYGRVAAAHGLATGFGDTASVGVAGLTLGGGFGFLHRKYGLTIDNLRGAEVVLADGRIVQVDSHEHPDLFWALRGGGGNFGVVTRLDFELHPVDLVIGGTLILPATPRNIVDFARHATEADEALTGLANIFPAPPMPFIPEEIVGEVVIFAMLVYDGPETAGEQAVSRFRSIDRPIIDDIARRPYLGMFEGQDDYTHPTAAVMRTNLIDEIDIAAGEAIIDGLRKSSAPMRATQIRALGGAVDRISREATAYAHRGRKMMVNVAAAYEDALDRPEHESWADDLATQVVDSVPGVYVNFLQQEGDDRLRQAYPEKTWERLVEVKSKYDPTNLFRINHNIPPDSQPV